MELSVGVWRERVGFGEAGMERVEMRRDEEEGMRVKRLLNLV